MKTMSPLLVLGIIFIILAFVLKLSDLPLHYFYGSLTIGIIFKTIFLIKGLRNGRIRMGFPLYLLFGGLGLLGLSLLLKYELQLLLLAKILLFIAIVLKTIAVVFFIKDLRKSL